MKIKVFLGKLNQIAPFSLQEEYDNSGVQFADLEENVSKVLICLDVTEEIIKEAVSEKCNVILSHHPLFFHPLKQITKQDHPLIYQLIFHHIYLISFHTNFDLAENGLNDYVGKLLGFRKISSIKSSTEKTFKLVTYIPETYQNNFQEALFKVGAGQVGNYSETSFSVTGKGSFKPLTGSNPLIGQTGKRETVNEVKFETIFLERYLAKIIEVIHLHHPYEEPAYDIYPIEKHTSDGIGMMTKLEQKERLIHFSKTIKKLLHIPYLRIIQANQKEIQTVALCTGSGGSLVDQCVEKQVDLFITGDIDHHEALKAKEKGLNIIDIEHFYTERYFVPAIQHHFVRLHIPQKLFIPSQKMIPPFHLL